MPTTLTTPPVGPRPSTEYSLADPRDENLQTVSNSHGGAPCVLGPLRAHELADASLETLTAIANPPAPDPVVAAQLSDPAVLAQLNPAVLGELITSHPTNPSWSRIVNAADTQTRAAMYPYLRNSRIRREFVNPKTDRAILALALFDAAESTSLAAASYADIDLIVESLEHPPSVDARAVLVDALVPLVNRRHEIAGLLARDSDPQIRLRLLAVLEKATKHRRTDLLDILMNDPDETVAVRAAYVAAIAGHRLTLAAYPELAQRVPVAALASGWGVARYRTAWSHAQSDNLERACIYALLAKRPEYLDVVVEDPRTPVRLAAAMNPEARERHLRTLSTDDDSAVAHAAFAVVAAALLT
jgi:hypothetical protein